MNGWERAARLTSTRARVQVENYTARLYCPTYSFTTVLRLARTLELRGWPEAGPSYVLLAEIGPDAADLHDPVVAELRRRYDRRPRSTMTLENYVAGAPAPSRRLSREELR